MRMLAVFMVILCSTMLCAGQLRESIPLDQAGNPAAGKFYLTVIVSDLVKPTSDDLALLEAMETEPMRWFRDQVVYNVWDNQKDILSKTDWANFIGRERPAVLLQGPSDQLGRAFVVVFINGQTLVDLIADLPQQIQDGLDRWTAKYGQRCPDGKCPIRPWKPRPEPAPQPEPAPVAPPVQPIVPTVKPPQPPAKEDSKGFPLVLLLPILLAGGAGIWSEFRKSN